MVEWLSSEVSYLDNDKRFRSYPDYASTWTRLREQNEILGRKTDCGDAVQRVLGYLVIDAVPELVGCDAKSVRAYMSDRDIVFENDALLPVIANQLMVTDVVEAFWKVISPELVNFCQPIMPLYAAYIDFCDAIGRKKRLSRRQFTGEICSVAGKLWSFPTDSDGRPARINLAKWVIGREPYLVALTGRAARTGSAGGTSLDELLAWMPPFTNADRVHAGGAIYRRVVRDWCVNHGTTPYDTMIERGWIDVEYPDLEQIKPWLHDKALADYWDDVTRAASEAQPRLLRACSH